MQTPIGEKRRIAKEGRPATGGSDAISDVGRMGQGGGHGRGMLMLWILFQLRKEPMSGYDIMKETESDTEAYKPQSGAVYPTLARMVRWGLIKVERRGERDKKVYELTGKGKALSSHIIENIKGRMRDVRSRRMIDSLMWPGEPGELRDGFESLSIAILDFRDSMMGTRVDIAKVRESIEKIKRIIAVNSVKRALKERKDAAFKKRSSTVKRS